MQDIFGVTINSWMGIIPLYALVTITTSLLIVLVIKFFVNALSGATEKPGPRLLRVIPNAGADESDNAQATMYVNRIHGPEKGKELPLSPALLSEEVKRLLEQGIPRVAEPRRVAESMLVAESRHVTEPTHEENYVLEFESIEAPEIEPCGGVEAAFERYCAATKAGRLKNTAGGSMLLQ
jgi:hypothetical protein